MLVCQPCSCRFHQNDASDDWQIYPTRDGDTLWNSTAHFPTATAPRYVKQIFEQLTVMAMEDDEERARKNKRGASTSPMRSEKRACARDLFVFSCITL